MSDLNDFISSGTGNPVVSGTVTGTNLVLTLNDASTITIDAVELKNLDTSVSIASPNWYQQYATPGGGSATPGAQISTTTPPNTANPYYYGVTLKRGREFAFAHSTGGVSIWYGIWNGTTTYTPADANKAAYWAKHLRIHQTQVSHGATDVDSVGFDLSTDYSITHGTTQCVLQYDYSSNKLKLWDVTGDYWHLAATASVAEDGNPVTISCAIAAGGAVPTFTDRESEWNIIAQVTADADATWRDGILQHSVIKHNRGLHPGEKMVLTTPNDPPGWQQQYFGFDYTGASIGQTNPHVQNTASIKVSSNERLYEHIGFTINKEATRWDDSDPANDFTDIMPGTKISIRYHLDYKIDIYDEDNEEVLFTKDTVSGYGTLFLHMYFSTNVGLDQLFYNWTFEPSALGWYYFAGNYNLKANEKFSAATLTGIDTRLSWGEKLYPGQELYWVNTATQDIEMGVRRVDDTAYDTSVRITSTKFDETGGTGTDIATRNPSGYAHSSKKAVLRYNFSSHKLQWLNVHTDGIETLIAEADTAEDGNGVIISCSGNQATPPTFVQRYYGWEYKHVSDNQPYQGWYNWRINKPAVNTTIRVDTVLQTRLAVIAGRYIQWVTTANEFAHFEGVWKSTNASTGLEDVEATTSFAAMWEWGYDRFNNEQIYHMHGMTLNTSNSAYNSAAGGAWFDPTPGTTQLRLRYKSDNSVDLYDITRSEVVLTKDVNLDGSPFYWAFGFGAGITSVTKFYAGGDLQTGNL